MISISGIIDGIATVHGRQVYKDIFLPLVGQQPRYIGAVGGNTRSDMETEVAGAVIIILEDIAAEVDAGGVQALLIPDDLSFQIPFISGLIARYSDEFVKVRAQRMRQRLVIMAVIVDTVIVLITIGTDQVGFELQVEVSDRKCVDIFEACLKPLFVNPGTVRIVKDLVKDKFVEIKP